MKQMNMTDKLRERGPAAFACSAFSPAGDEIWQGGCEQGYYCDPARRP